jgi:predicted ATPase/transcriptional regulator with XRE-family HTH domain
VQRGWTQQDLAEQIGIADPQTISRWECGATSPSLKHRRALSEVFDLTMEELGLADPLQQGASPPVSSPDEVQKKSLSSPLPCPETSFVGRQKEIVQASRLLQRPDTRLVTLLGTGGVGKTRLGLQIASRLFEHFRDGVCFVALESIHDPDLVIATLARALGIPASGKQALAESVNITLRARNVLLLLDSFEHLVAAAPLLDEVIQACPQVKLLITSRVRLYLPAEHVFPVSPLAPEPAQLEKREALIHCAPVELFARRAQLVQPEFAVTVKNVQTVLELCKQLDYLPLAIELAAFQSLLFSPRALLARLPRAFDLLLNEWQGVPERQRTLAGTLRWSYELLTAEQQWLFRRLAVFSGGVTLSTLEDFFRAQGCSPPDILHLTHALLQKSLLQRERSESANPRVFLLNTVRDYGLHYLDTQGELEQCQRAHAMYYLSLVEEAALYLAGGEQGRWLLSLEQERLNLQAALEWLLHRQESSLALRFVEAFGKFCGLRGDWSEEYHWLQRALRLPCPCEARMVRARVLRRIGYLSYRFRNLEVAQTFQEESIALSRECMDLHNLAGALVGLGLVLYRQKEIEHAYQILSESVIVAHETSDSWVIANALHSLARVALFLGRIDEAEALLCECRRLSQRLSDKDLTVRMLSTLISVVIVRGHLAQAALYAQESLNCAREFGTAPLVALALNTMGRVACLQKDYTRAKRYLNESIAIACRMGDELMEARGYVRLAEIALAEGDVQTISMFVHKKAYQRYDIPELAGILEACKQYMQEKKTCK